MIGGGTALLLYSLRGKLTLSGRLIFWLELKTCRYSWLSLLPPNPLLFWKVLLLRLAFTGFTGISKGSSQMSPDSFTHHNTWVGWSSVGHHTSNRYSLRRQKWLLAEKFFSPTEQCWCLLCVGLGPEWGGSALLHLLRQALIKQLFLPRGNWTSWTRKCKLHSQCERRVFLLFEIGEFFHYLGGCQPLQPCYQEFTLFGDTIWEKS